MGSASIIPSCTDSPCIQVAEDCSSLLLHTASCNRSFDCGFLLAFLLSHDHWPARLRNKVMLSRRYAKRQMHRNVSSHTPALRWMDGWMDDISVPFITGLWNVWYQAWPKENIFFFFTLIYCFYRMVTISNDIYRWTCLSDLPYALFTGTRIYA